MKRLAFLVALLPTLALAQAVSSGGGASLPAGSCGVNMSCSVSSLTSASTVQSDATSGTYALKASTLGSKVGWTGQAYFDSVDTSTVRTFATLRAEGGIDMRGGSLSASYFGSVRVVNSGGLTLIPMSAPWTCSNTTTASGQKVESGTLAVISGSAGKPQRLCLCTYDGTTYRWLNVGNVSDTSGTSTTCPEYP